MSLATRWQSWELVYHDPVGVYYPIVVVDSQYEPSVGAFSSLGAFDFAVTCSIVRMSVGV